MKILAKYDSSYGVRIATKSRVVSMKQLKNGRYELSLWGKRRYAESQINIVIEGELNILFIKTRRAFPVEIKEIMKEVLRGELKK